MLHLPTESNYNVTEEDGIEPMAAATFALAARLSKYFARSHPPLS